VQPSENVRFWHKADIGELDFAVLHKTAALHTDVVDCCPRPRGRCYEAAGLHYRRSSLSHCGP
jgi:hypothetical protein